MSQDFKPEGYNSVSPYLVLGDVDATISFLKEVFDCEETRRIQGKDGRVIHAEVRIDDTIVMMGVVPDPSMAVSAHVHVYVPDVDETYSRALAAGGESVQEPTRKDDEDKRGAVRDAGGTTWWISTKVG